MFAGLVSAFLLIAMVTTVTDAAEEYVDSAKYKKNPPYVVGLSNVAPANPFKVAMVEEFKAEAEKFMPNL